MESYRKGKKLLEEKYGKLISLQPFNDDNGTVDNKQQKFVKQIIDISDEEGLRSAYEAKSGLYQHWQIIYRRNERFSPRPYI